jgi:hypothetical protein
VLLLSCSVRSQLFSSFVHTNQPESAGNSSSSSSRALVAAAYQLRRQGYNAVYLPFTFSDLQGSSSSSSSSSSSRTSQRCTQVPLTSLGTSHTGSQGAAASHSSADWLQQLALQGASGGTAAGTQAACLSLLPNTTTLDRYLWSVQWFLANGLYVIMSSDVGSTTGAGVSCSSSNSSSSSSSCTQDTAAAADAWAWLWKAVVALPHFDASVQGRVLLQLANDPNNRPQQWESTKASTGQKQPGKLVLLQLHRTRLPERTSDMHCSKAACTGEGILLLGVAHTCTRHDHSAATAAAATAAVLQGPGQRAECMYACAAAHNVPFAGLQQLYLAILDAVDWVKPGSAVFILQGPQQQGPPGPNGPQWGTGFSAGPALISQGVSGWGILSGLDE